MLKLTDKGPDKKEQKLKGMISSQLTGFGEQHIMMVVSRAQREPTHLFRSVTTL